MEVLMLPSRTEDQNGESGKRMGGAPPRSKASRCRNDAPMPAATCIQPVCAVLGVRPADPRGVAARARQDLCGDPPREGEGRGVAGGAVVGEEELGDAG